MTSFSRLRQAPWAALIAVVVVVWVDRRVLADRERWLDVRERLEALPEPVVRLEIGKTKDVLQLGNLREAPPEERRLVLMGNSRARVGLNLRLEPEDGIRLAKLAHAAVSPYVMRTMAREVAAAEPDLVVLMLSELDTHRPVELVPGACFRSPDALAQLLAAEPSIAWRERHQVERILVGNLLTSYREGDILDRAWLNDLREIRTQEAEEEPDEPAARGRRGGRRQRRKPLPRKQLEIEAEDARYRVQKIEEPDVDPPPLENLDEIRAEFETFFKRERVRNSTLNIGYAIRMGPHADTQKGLVEETVRILTEAGSRVMIVEGPLNPLTYLLYDEETTRADFLAFVERLKATYGVHFLSIEETGPWVERDFTDLLHVTGLRARDLSAVVKERVVALLDDQKR